MRDTTVANSAGYLAGRNDAILTLLYDTGLRVGELVALDVETLYVTDVHCTTTKRHDARIGQQVARRNAGRPAQPGC